MAGFSVKLKYNDLPRIVARAPKKADTAVKSAAFETERYIKTSFGTGGFGRTYKRAGKLVAAYKKKDGSDVAGYRRKGKAHVASAPGSPPGIDTGKLRAGINTKKLRELVYSVNTGDTEYAPHLEFGTSKMAARPFMGPAAQEAEGFLLEAFRKAFEKP